MSTQPEQRTARSASSSTQRDVLRRAQEALTAAYEQARDCGYKPGSQQMRALELAERHFQKVSRAVIDPTTEQASEPG